MRAPLHLVALGGALGDRLDAGHLPVTEPAKAQPSRLVDLAQDPKPIVVWCPTRWQLFCRDVRRALQALL